MLFSHISKEGLSQTHSYLLGHSSRSSVSLSLLIVHLYLIRTEIGFASQEVSRPLSLWEMIGLPEDRLGQLVRVSVTRYEQIWTFTKHRAMAAECEGCFITMTAQER